MPKLDAANVGFVEVAPLPALRGLLDDFAQAGTLAAGELGDLAVSYVVHATLLCVSRWLQGG